MCAAKGLKPWPYLWIDQTKINILFKAQTRKMTSYVRETIESQNGLNGSTLLGSVILLELTINPANTLTLTDHLFSA